MSKHLLDGHPLHPVLRQQSKDEVLALRACKLPTGMPFFELDLLVNGLSCGFFDVSEGIKWQYTTQHYVNDDAERPEIYVFAIRTLEEDLRSHIGLQRVLIFHQSYLPKCQMVQ